MLPRFEPEWPLTDLQPADYNPRHLADDALTRLRASLDRYGVIKPVILNADGTLVAGHQRTKALKANGKTTVPAIVFSVKVARRDEITFNLFHNSVETNIAEVQLPKTESGAYAWVEPGDVQVLERGRNAEVVRSMCKLIGRYGAWGSVVTSPEGTVLLNSDYALACQLMGKQVLTYRLPADQLETFHDDLYADYGVYSYGALGVKSYNQLNCQMRRNPGHDGNKSNMKSTLYEQYVLPWLDTRPKTRMVDFGAGLGAYVRVALSRGHAAYAYEPHLAAAGTKGINVNGVVAQLRAIERDVSRNGLYPLVVLDSVLNSVISLEFEDKVLRSCAALMADDGTFWTATRSAGAVEKRNSGKVIAGSARRYVEFLDPDGFTATYREGVWTMQRFHTKASLEETLRRYFADVEVLGHENRSNIYARCARPLRQPREATFEALDVELNMELPGGRHHGKHASLRDRLLDLNMHRVVDPE
jgi:hypothetical protein